MGAGRHRRRAKDNTHLIDADERFHLAAARR
jgi:hypothetical protein